MADNEMHLEFMSLSQNEAFARSTAGAFFTQLNPTLEQLTDVRTAISEAVTNAIIHGYTNKPGTIKLSAYIENGCCTFTVCDNGVGIDDIELARQPFYTSHPELERSGMGFTVMETFMDEVSVQSEIGRGTTITMKKNIVEKNTVENSGAKGNALGQNKTENITADTTTPEYDDEEAVNDQNILKEPQPQ